MSMEDVVWYYMSMEDVVLYDQYHLLNAAL